MCILKYIFWKKSINSLKLELTADIDPNKKQWYFHNNKHSSFLSITFLNKKMGKIWINFTFIALKILVMYRKNSFFWIFQEEKGKQKILEWMIKLISEKYMNVKKKEIWKWKIDCLGTYNWFNSSMTKFDFMLLIF